MNNDNIIIFPFLDNKAFQYNELNVLDYKLTEISFNYRFSSIIDKHLPNFTILDLLNISPESILGIKKIGIRTVNDIQSILLEYLFDNGFKLMNLPVASNGVSNGLIITRTFAARASCGELYPERLKNYKECYSFFKDSDLPNVKFDQEILNKNVNELKIYNHIKLFFKKEVILNNISDLLNNVPNDLFDTNNINVTNIEYIRKNIYDIIVNLSKGLSPFPFLKNVSYSEEIINEDAFIKPLKSLDLNQRTLAALKSLPGVITIYDLLFLSPDVFKGINNFGNKSISVLQNILIETIFKPSKRHNYRSNLLDDIIVENLFRKIKSTRNVMAFLKYYGYNNSEKITLTEIGKEFSLTRERVRQIMGQIKNKISANSTICEMFLNQLNGITTTTKASDFLNYLIRNGLWNSQNELFFYNILSMISPKSFNFKIINDYIVVNKEYEITSFISTI